MSHVFCLFYKVVKLVGGESVINGPTTSSFWDVFLQISGFTHYSREIKSTGAEMFMSHVPFLICDSWPLELSLRCIIHTCVELLTVQIYSEQNPPFVISNHDRS